VQTHQISVHRSIDDRLSAAAKLQSSFAIPANMTVVADTMTDDLNQTYGAVPERLYVVQNGLVMYEGGQGPYNFCPAEVDDWLKVYRERSSAENESDSVKGEASG